MTPRFRPPSAVVCAAAVLVLGAMTAGQMSGFRVNTTPSMPVGLWRVEAISDEPRRGEIVTVCPPDIPMMREASARGYIGTGSCSGGYEPLVKRVAAIAGDMVHVSPAGINVNGEAVTGTAQLNQDSAGRMMQPYPAGVHQVPAFHVWLLSGHDPRSFDSRYFGPVSAENVQAVARPVWVR